MSNIFTKFFKQLVCEHKYPKDWFEFPNLLDNPDRSFVCPKCDKRIKQRESDLWKTLNQKDKKESHE